MVADVHLRIEYKDESDKWQLDQCSTDYNEFSFLMALMATRYNTDKCEQSHPSFTLKELQEYPWLDKMFSIINNVDKDRNKNKDDICRYIGYRVKFYGEITSELKKLAELHGGAENVRIVFFFNK